MYVEPTTTYYQGTEMHVRKARFLILMQPKDEPAKGNNIRAVVRIVALHQLGHWMMGRANINGEWIIISGAYGQDGLPKTVDRKIWERGIPLPDELYQAWSKGGGWNSAGNEAEAMREWACEQFKVGNVKKEQR